MAILQSRLRAEASSGPFEIRTLDSAQRLGYRTAFLCHSHRDAQLVRGLVVLLKASGWTVYVDWADTEMPSTPSVETAARIKVKIRSHHYFLFLATEASMASRWCPWELGFADGVKSTDSILIIPTSDGSRAHGNEYLGLYRRIDMDALGGVRVYRPGDTSGNPIRAI